MALTLERGNQKQFFVPETPVDGLIPACHREVNTHQKRFSQVFIPHETLLF